MKCYKIIVCLFDWLWVYDEYIDFYIKLFGIISDLILICILVDLNDFLNWSFTKCYESILGTKSIYYVNYNIIFAPWVLFFANRVLSILRWLYYWLFRRCTNMWYFISVFIDNHWYDIQINRFYWSLSQWLTNRWWKFGYKKIYVW